MLSRSVEGNYFTHRHAIVEHAIRVAEEIRMKSVVWVVGMGSRVRVGEKKLTARVVH